MDISEFFPSNYLRVQDLNGQRVAVTIENVAAEEIGDDEKPVCYFVGIDKGLVLNKTNANSIREIAGTGDVAKWPGVEVVLYEDRTDFQGKRVPCIRIEAPKKVNSKVRSAFTAAPADDDIAH